VESLAPQTKLVKIQDTALEIVPNEISQVFHVQNEMMVAPLKRLVRKRRYILPPKYVVYL